MKKSYLAFVLVAVMLSTCACQGQPDISLAPTSETSNLPESELASVEVTESEKTELSGSIRFGIYTDTSRDKVAKAQAELFMAQNPGVTVEVVSVPYANYYTQLATGFASNNAWDVFMINGANFGAMAPKGVLKDLTDLMEEKGLSTDDFVVDETNSVYNGMWMALPYELNSSAIFYNKDMFDEVGVEYPTADWTWEEFLEKAQKLTNKEEQKWGIYLRMGHPDVTSFIAQAGGSMYNEDRTQLTIDTPECREAIQFMSDMVLTHEVAPAPKDLPANIAPFMTGKVAMASALSFEILSTMKAPFNWGVVSWPKHKQYGADFWTQAIAIYNKTSNEKLAMEFANFLLSEDAQMIMADEKGATPALISVASSEEYTNNGPDGMRVFIQDYIDGKAVAEPFTSKWGAISGGATSVLQTEMARIYMGTQTVDGLIEVMNKDAQKILDEQ